MRCLSASTVRAPRLYHSLRGSHLDPGARERLFSTSGLLAGPSPNSLQDKIAGDADMALGDSVSLRADLVNRAFATHCMCHWANEVGVPTSVLRGAKQELEAEAHEGNHNFAASYLIPLHSSVAWKEISELVAGQLHASWALRATLAPVLESLARSVRDGVCLDPHLEAHFHADPHKGALSMETLPWYNKYGVAQAVVRSQENALQRCIDIAALALQRFFGSPSDSLPPACLIAAKYACTLAQQAASPAAAEVAGREEKGTSGADMASEEVMRQCALTLVHTFIVTPLRMVLAHKRGPLAPMGSLGGIVPDSAEDAAGRHSEPSPDCTLRGKMLEGLEAVSQLVVAAVLGVEPQPGFLGLVDDEQLARVRAFVQEWAAKSMAALDVLSDSVGRAMTATRCRREHSALLERGVAFANILVPPRMLLRCGDIQQIMHVVEKYYRRPQGARTLTVLSPFMSRAAQAAFVTVCGSTGSSLSPAGIHEALKLLGHRMGEEELATMLGGVASQPSGNVNFAAFAQIASHVMTTEPSTHHRASNAVESLFSAWEEAPFNAAVLDNGAEPTTLVEVFPMVMAGGGNAAPTLASLVQDAYGDNSGLQFVLNELRYVLRSAPATTFERALRGAMEMRGVLPRGVPDSSTDAASAALEEHVSAGSLEADSRSLQTWGLSPGEARRQALDVLAKGSARTNALWQRMRAQLFIDDKAALMVGREGETEDERRDREALLKQVQEMGGKGSSPRGRARRLSLAELASSDEAEGGMARYMTASLLRSDEQSWLEAPVGGMDKLPEGAGGAPAELTESFRAVVLRFAKSAFLRVFMEPVGERLLERRKVRVSATGLPDVDASPSECRPCVRLQVLNDAASAVVFQSETEAVAGSASPEWERVIALPTINRPSQHSVVFTITTETSYGGRKVIGSARRPLSVLDVGTGTCSVVFATAANTQATLSLSVFDCGVAPSEQEAEEAGVAIMQQALLDAAGMVAEGAASRGERVLAFRANRLRIALDHLAAMQKPRLDPGVVHRVMRNVRDGEAGTLALLRYLEARARTRGAAGAGAAHSTLQDQGTAGNSSTVGSAGLCTNSDATLPSLARSQSAGSELRVLDLVEELCATPHSESRPPRTMKTLLETVPEVGAAWLRPGRSPLFRPSAAWQRREEPDSPATHSRPPSRDAGPFSVRRGT